MASEAAGLGVKERREAQRMAVRHCRAWIRRCLWPLPIPSGPEYAASVLNLSFTGMALRGPQHYRLGEHVVVTLYPKAAAGAPKARLTLRGRVAWCSASGGAVRETVGIRFSGRAQAVRQRILAWVARHRKLLV